MKKAVDVVTIAYYLVLIGVILWSLSDEPVKPTQWHTTMRTCQNLARFFATAGMRAELHYYDAVEESQL